MAVLEPAVRRIKYVLGKGPYTGSPSTISGDADTVASYAKVIGRAQPDGSWIVVDPQSSQTTNRHIRALYSALTDLGISYTVEDYHRTRI